MINLLPADDIRTLKIARFNRLLARYAYLTGIFAIIFVGVIASGLYFLSHQETTAINSIQESEVKISKLNNTQKEIKEFKDNLALNKALLDQRINYSLALVRFNAVTPKGVKVDRLQLNAGFFDSPQQITVKGLDENRLIAYKTALQGSPYFSNIGFSNITIATGSTAKQGDKPAADDPYRATATISMIVKKDIYDEKK